MRVYLQCQYWCLNPLHPTDWGWQVNDNVLTPIYSSRPLLPDKFLKKFNCSCKSGCKKRCTCKKLGLCCHIFCKVCKGKDCQNSENILTVQSFTDEEEYDESYFLPMGPEASVNTSQEVEASEYTNESYDIYEPEIYIDEHQNDEVMEINDNEEDVSFCQKRQRLQ